MKNILSIILVLVSISVFAQDFSFGAKGGLNVSILAGDDLRSYGSRGSIHIGGFAEFKLSSDIAIQPELLYSVQGGKIKVFNTNNEDIARFKMNYITVPVLLKYYVDSKFTLEAGPQVAFLVLSEYEEGSFTRDIENGKSGVFSGNLGLGYALNSHLFFQARYNIGISKLHKNYDATNQVFQLSAGYKF